LALESASIALRKTDLGACSEFAKEGEASNDMA
jgi:hypothetical protein